MGKRRTMIVEIPDPGRPHPPAHGETRSPRCGRCLPSSFIRPTDFTYRVHHVRIAGVGFFDFLHGQSGVAPNGLELHPVTKIG